MTFLQSINSGCKCHNLNLTNFFRFTKYDIHKEFISMIFANYRYSFLDIYYDNFIRNYY